MIIRTLIVDDDPDQIKILKYFLRRYSEVKIIGEARTGEEAIHLITQYYPDLVFLDIELPDINGIRVVREITSKDYEPLFIFVTSFPQYAVEGFDLEVLDYLVKPVQPERLEKALSRVQAKLQEMFPGRAGPGRAGLPRYLSFVSVKVNQTTHLVPANEIVFVSWEDSTVVVHTARGSGLTKFRSLDQLEALLDPQMFVRVHRRYLVNVNKIKEIVPWFKGTFALIMRNEKQTQILMSRRGAQKLRRHVRW